MLPYIHFFGRAVPTYGLLTGVGILLSVLWFELRARRLGENSADFELAFLYALIINRDEEPNAICGMALIKGQGAGEAIVMQYLIAQCIGWVLPKAQIAGIKLTIDLGLDLDRAIV